ncbi:MAG: PD-(D/E)XK nuclease family protein [Desulfovibrio sp.]|jgi:RecB family exonuclease|nr:PD-(D/E)XK nuclease family protein [Desulfovibrio sp.]
MSANLIHLVPWSADFIAALAEHLAARVANNADELAATRVVFPHNRPARHLRAALAAHPALPRPCLMPRMQSLDDFLSALRRELSPKPLLRAGKLDRIGVLHGIVRELGLANGPLQGLAGDARAFFPWGARLAGLLEEMAGQGVRPAAIHNLAGEVTPWAEALLGQLDAIGQAYHAALDARGWTTPGLDSLWLSQHLDEAAQALSGERLVFAGFHALSGTEEPVLHRLWREGAEVFWHSDPALASGERSVWAAREHGRWLARWRARAVPVQDAPDAATRISAPQVRRFYEGFDLHSQLSVLQRELSALPDTASTAVVLPDPGALVPVMHHLPAAEANISMGYPLGRSALAQLLESILTLHENGDGAGKYAWRDLVALVRHPLLRVLRAGDAAEMPLKSAYVAWERHIRAAGAYQSPAEWAFVYEADDFSAPEDEVRALHAEVLNACFANFAKVRTLRQAGEALDALCGLLRNRGGDTWRRNLIDAECLLRLWQSVVPELTGSILADEDYGQALVFLMLRHLVDAERVSFEPEPLAGLQVLGMLETRLLSFERLFILDATEDKLPGANAPDPLLPDPLRQALGLPGRRERDSVAAHNFFRLLMGARQVTVLYQAGVRPGALEGKSERSRYVEQLLWELEARQGALVKARPMDDEHAPLRAVGFPVCPILPSRPPVAMTPALRARLAARLADKGVTPSQLEVWLTCPKKALYAQVLGLRPMQEVEEDGDRARLGEIVHRVLKDFLTPLVGRPIHAQMLDAEALGAAFAGAVLDEPSFREMPYDARVALLAAGRERLGRFAANLPSTTVRALELPVLTRVALGGMEGAVLADVALQGRIDRVDERTGERTDDRAGAHMVLDYKTGGIKGSAQAWLDGDLFQRMAAAAPGSPEAEQLYRELAESGLDVQLPLYLHLLSQTPGYDPGEAAWVELKSDGSEKPLFGPKVEPEDRTAVIADRAPALVRFTLSHLLAAPELPALPGRHCDWCDFKALCGA